MNTPMIGSHLKVYLPGESPWVIVTAVLPDGRILGRIDNKLIDEDHGYQFGDVVTLDCDERFGIWKPVDCQINSDGQVMS